MYLYFSEYQRPDNFIGFLSCFLHFSNGTYSLAPIYRCERSDCQYWRGRILFASLFIALLFIYLGYHRAAQKDSSIPITYQYDSVGVLAIRKYTKKLSYFTFLFASIVIYEQIRFVLVNGYFAFYVDFESNLPYPVILAGTLFDYFV